MGKLLAIDLGNTRAKAGVFLNGKLIQRVLFECSAPEPLEKLLTQHKIDEAILSSVVENHFAIERIVSNYTILNTLQSISNYPIRNKYKTPETLGADRLACAVGASVIFPGKNVLSIDAGTCIKYDIVDRSGSYLGG
ncbi:MAG: hypothetical protein RIQ47_1483, partial [Bacteroidota bacterium]